MIEFLDKNLLAVIFGATGAIVYHIFYLGSYKNKIDQVEKDIGRLDDHLIQLIKEVSVMKGKSEVYMQANSPWSLTDKGKALLLDSGGKDYIDKNMKNLLSSLEEKNPKSSYDIQEFSKEVLKCFSIEDEFIPIKEFIYKEGINLDVLIEVLGVYLRDKFMEKNQ